MDAWLFVLAKTNKYLSMVPLVYEGQLEAKNENIRFAKKTETNVQAALHALPCHIGDMSRRCTAQAFLPSTP